MSIAHYMERVVKYTVKVNMLLKCVISDTWTHGNTGGWTDGTENMTSAASAGNKKHTVGNDC